MVVFVEPAKTNGQESGDPLLRAIADLRVDIDRLIDAQLASLGTWEASVREPEPAFAHGASAAPAPAHSPPHPEPAAEWYPLEPLHPANGTKNGKRPASRPVPGTDLPPVPAAPTAPPAPPVSPSAPPTATPSLQAPTESNADPRSRLDALAKRLDGRLKRGNGGAGERPSTETDA